VSLSSDVVTSPTLLSDDMSRERYTPMRLHGIHNSFLRCSHFRRGCLLYSSFFVEPFNVNDDDDDEEEEGDYDDDDDEEEEEEADPYAEKAQSEFVGSTSDLAPVGVSSLDWGSALSSLRTRIDDVESGASSNPSNALFRIMTRETPNEAIGNFVNSADPQVVAAMSGAVGSLLGGLSNPVMGVETIIKASGEKLANLCFQLQMTGYMFRNAEYVLALKDLMNIRGKATVEEYREAFNRLDTDGSGYIETDEISDLLKDVYDDEAPSFEVQTFLKFFDSNDDGRISWDEFERGLGAMNADTAASAVASAMGGKPMADDDDDELDDDDEYDDIDISAGSGRTSVSGKIKVELESGKIIEVEAEDYINDLKEEARALKEALARESGESLSSEGPPGGLGGIVASGNNKPSASDEVGGVAGYIASLQGDVKALTEGISPEVVDAMKQLVDFVLDSGGQTKSGRQSLDKDKEMSLTGSALQQLALWQLVLGYRLREAEATGEYRRLLE